MSQSLHQRGPITAVLRIAALVLLLLSPSILLSQRYPIVLVPGSPRGGLFNMMQDSQSRIWIGTIDDALMFDGSRFYSIRQDGFPKEYPNAFGEDSDGGIWIATQGTDSTGGTAPGGLYRYENGHVEKLFSVDGLGVVNVAPGIMLVAFGTEAQAHPTYGDLYRFEKRGTTWIGEKMLEKYADHLTIDAQGTTLFPCPPGWCELSHQAALDWKPGMKPAVQEHAGDPLIERVVRDRYGCLWFRSEPQGSYQCPGDPSVTTLPVSILGFDASDHMEEAPDGSAMFMVPLTVGRPGNFQSSLLRNGMPADIDTALVAKDGTIWVAAASGLYRFMYPFRLEYWNQDQGLERVNSFARAGHKILAASTGVATLSADRGTWSTVPGTAALNGIGALLSGPAGTFFATSEITGLSELRPDGTVVARSGFVDSGTALARSKDGIWLGTGAAKKIGVRRVSVKGDRLVITNENLPLEPTPDLSYDEQSDTLWSCFGNGVAFRHEGVWHRIMAKDGLVDFPCRTVGAHPNGDVWVGYENSWFSLIQDPFLGHPKIRNFAAESGRLVANSGNSFFNVDHRGWVWRGTGYGVFTATGKAAEEDHWLRMDDQAGVPVEGGNENSFFEDEDGSIWYATGATVVHFSPPEGFATEFPAPKIFVSGFSARGGPALLADNVSSLPHSSDVKVHIGSLQFDRRNAIHLRYRLLPEQSGWTSQNDWDIHLGKLKSGSHTLEVQAQMATGAWSNTTSKSFTILKPIWLSWPVLLGFVVVGGAGGAGVYRWRKKRAARAAKNLPSLGEWRLAALTPEVWHLAGTVLDSRFEVGEVLTRGGFATIAKGKDLQQGGLPCAIKIFRQEVTDQEWMTRRFQQEVLALEKIHHSNVVRIYGHGTTLAGSQYLVMEFIEGQTLREKLELGRLSPRQAASYLQQTGNALEEIHGHGICHRDLKPENLMIRDTSPQGQDLVLIDFSIAIVKDPDVTMHGLSRAAGTLYYMAPEQSIGYADSSTDIYSLAKVVIEMLTGERLSTLLPDASMDLPERVRELLSGLNLGLSSVTIELISSALQFDPAGRPKGAAAFANQIAADLANVPSQA